MKAAGKNIISYSLAFLRQAGFVAVLLLLVLLSSSAESATSKAPITPHFEVANTSDAEAQQKIADCMKNLDPKVAAMIQEAIDKNPILASTQAQLGFLAMISNESNFRNIQYGKSTVCEGKAIAYGYTQVTHRDFNNEIMKAMGKTSKLDGLAGKAWNAQFCAELEEASVWMMENPSKNFEIGSAEYITRLKQENGDVMTALNKVCGGNNLAKNKDLCMRTAGDTRGRTYQQAILAKIATLSQCTSDSGEGVTPGNYQPPPDGYETSKMINEKFECADIDLSKALEKAAAFFNALSMATSRTAQEEGVKAARENMNRTGNVFDSVNNRLCFDMMDRFNSLIEALLGVAGTILNMLISFINQMISLACQYVVAAISNALTSICIPLPDLPSMPGFGGGPNRKSCNGLSMADLVSMSSHPAQVTPSQLGIYDYQKTIRNKATDTVTRGL